MAAAHRVAHRIGTPVAGAPQPLVAAVALSANSQRLLADLQPLQLHQPVQHRTFMSSWFSGAADKASSSNTSVDASVDASITAPTQLDSLASTGADMSQTVDLASLQSALTALSPAPDDVTSGEQQLQSKPVCLWLRHSLSFVRDRTCGKQHKQP